MKTIIMLAALALAGCATTPPPEPSVRTVTVNVPVAEPCAAHVDARQRYADQDASAAADIYEQVRALLTGISQRSAREEKLENAVTSCGGTVK